MARMVRDQGDESKLRWAQKPPKRCHVVGDAETVLQRRLMHKVLG
jgi:hypothetical protein